MEVYSWLRKESPADGQRDRLANQRLYNVQSVVELSHRTKQNEEPRG